ncbi:MAG: TadE/TadG family type IV pilus assembly protein [Planctomycetaceae bacterium]
MVRPKQKQNRLPQTNRRAAVTVETAIIFPVVVLFVFAQIELVRLNNIRNSVYMAAYEGARAGIVPGAKAADCQGAANTILAAVATINGTVSVTPATITDKTEQVTVSVSVPLDDNSWTTPLYAPGKTLAASVTLTREKDDTIVGN